MYSNGTLVSVVTATTRLTIGVLDLSANEEEPLPTMPVALGMIDDAGASTRQEVTLYPFLPLEVIQDGSRLKRYSYGSLEYEGKDATGSYAISLRRGTDNWWDDMNNKNTTLDCRDYERKRDPSRWQYANANVDYLSLLNREGSLYDAYIQANLSWVNVSDDAVNEWPSSDGQPLETGAYATNTTAEGGTATATSSTAAGGGFLSVGEGGEDGLGATTIALIAIPLLLLFAGVAICAVLHRRMRSSSTKEGRHAGGDAKNVEAPGATAMANVQRSRNRSRARTIERRTTGSKRRLDRYEPMPRAPMPAAASAVDMPAPAVRPPADLPTVSSYAPVPAHYTNVQVAPVVPESNAYSPLQLSTRESDSSQVHSYAQGTMT
jgi:hypothetical protein